jgi:glycosyl transferase family 2
LNAVGPIACSYVLPVRWEVERRGDLDWYLRQLSASCQEVIVVDGSPEHVFGANARMWGDHVRHIRPQPEAGLNGKAAGANTGVHHASHEAIVIADDDVRYHPNVLQRTIELLAQSDLVRPQNYFSPLPWHARWDTSRILLNRALGADFPGTLAVRRSRLRATGGYDANVLFENLELIRTVEADGGRVVTPPDLYVRRLPPTPRHFWGQRTRQAYDDFAIPVRMLVWLMIIPALVVALQGRKLWPVSAAASSVLIAERGRRRAGGRAVFPVTSSLLAPVWLLERGICSWLAVMQRVRYGGVRYSHNVLPVAAHSRQYLLDRKRTRGRGQS